VKCICKRDDTDTRIVNLSRAFTTENESVLYLICTWNGVSEVVEEKSAERYFTGVQKSSASQQEHHGDRKLPSHFFIPSLPRRPLIFPFCDRGAAKIFDKKSTRGRRRLTEKITVQDANTFWHKRANTLKVERKLWFVVIVCILYEWRMIVIAVWDSITWGEESAR